MTVFGRFFGRKNLGVWCFLCRVRIDPAKHDCQAELARQIAERKKQYAEMQAAAAKESSGYSPA